MKEEGKKMTAAPFETAVKSDYDSICSNHHHRPGHANTHPWFQDAE